MALSLRPPLLLLPLTSSMLKVSDLLSSESSNIFLGSFVEAFFGEELAYMHAFYKRSG